MNLHVFQWRSLKTRVTLFTLAIFLMGIWSLAFYASRMLRDDMQSLLAEQQVSTVSMLATGVSQELDRRLRALEKIAEKINPAMMGNPVALQAFLEERLTFEFLFNAGAFATGLDGMAIADIPLSTGRIGVEYLDRDYIAAALRESKATVGRPFMGKVLRAPMVAMAVPIRDPEGIGIGALAGVIDLGKPNFLDKISAGRYGKTGNYFLTSRQHRLIVTASDKSRVMGELPAPGSIPWIDRAMNGYEGSGVYVDQFGVEVLASAQRVPEADWVMSMSLPTADAFAPIRAMQRRVLVAAIVLTLLAGALTWWMIRRQLAPMVVAVNTLAALSAADRHPQPLPVSSQDEIGELVGGFNRLLGTLGKREEELRRSKHQYDALAARIPVGIYLLRSKPDGSFALDYASPRMAEMLNLSVASLVADAKSVFQAIHPDDRNSFVTLNQEGIQLMRPFDWIGRVPVGESLKWLHFSSSPEPQDDGTILWFGLVADVTGRKLMEDQMRELATHDALTKLPNRRLLNDRLSQTMAASKRSGCYGAVMFLDLDNFKLLNDTHGHGVGDLLLIEAAGRLKACVREMDTVARFGGDEFVVMISELDVDRAESVAQAGVIAEKVRAALARPYVFEIQREGEAAVSVEHQCTASIGVTLFVRQEASQDDILKWADAAMYQAKAAGCDLIRFFNPQA